MTPTSSSPTANPLALAVAGLVLTMALALVLGGVAPAPALPLVVAATALVTGAAVAATRARRRPRAGLDPAGGLGPHVPHPAPDVGEHGPAPEVSLSDSRRDLVAWISDDLRTPLARIRSTAEALERGDLDDPVEVAGAVLALDEEIDRLSALLGDIVELSGTAAPDRRAPGDHDGELVGALPAPLPAAVPGGAHRPVGAFDLAFGRYDPTRAPAARRPDDPGAGPPR